MREEARPDPRDADELHDALMTAGFLTADEIPAAGPMLDHARRRAAARPPRALGSSPPSGCRELLAVHPAIALEPTSRRRRHGRVHGDGAAAIVELLRGRLTLDRPDHR